MARNAKTDRRLRVASVQMESLPADKETNFSKIEGFVKQATGQGVRLILFPDSCVTGYWFIRNLSGEQLASLAETVPEGPSTRRLAELAQQHQLTIGAGLVEAAGGGVFHNTYIVALPNGVIHRH